MIAVREMDREEIGMMIRYFLDATPQFLRAMGVDRDLLPAYDAWMTLIEEDFDKPIEERQFFYVIWMYEEKPIGHSNINKIVFGKEAYMHLHLWKPDKRQQGIGSSLVRLSLPHYFQNFHLKELYCEPYSLNVAPNKTLERTGFQFVEEYETVPGLIQFKQPVKRWKMTRDGFLLLRS
jgi:RimJ/RimL family protein N-acetyltransferase